MNRTRRTSLLSLVIGLILTLALGSQYANLHAEEAAPTRIPGTSVEFLAPEGAGAAALEVPAPGEWVATWSDATRKHWFQIRTFPVRGNQSPTSVITSAVDMLMRSQGVAGFGMPEKEERKIWGHAAADARFEFARGADRFSGRVRLLLDAPQRWVLAVCHVPYAERLQQQSRTRAFLAGLQHQAPAFYGPRFDERGAHQQIRLGVKQGQPLTLAEVAATEAVLESGLGYRVPLGDRAMMRRALLALPRREGPKGVKAMRDMKRAVDAAMKQPAEKRVPFLAAIGEKMVAGMRARVEQSDPAALEVMKVVLHLEQPAATHDDKRLPRGLWRSRLEMGAFLASVLRDEATRLDIATQEALEKELTKRFSTDAALLLRSDRDWARLRRAWDLATPEARHALRRTLGAALLPKEHAAALQAAKTPREIFAALEAARQAVPAADVLSRAVWWSDFAPLWKALGRDEGGFHFGW